MTNENKMQFNEDKMVKSDIIRGTRHQKFFDFRLQKWGLSLFGT